MRGPAQASGQKGAPSELYLKVKSPADQSRLIVPKLHAQSSREVGDAARYPPGELCAALDHRANRLETRQSHPPLRQVPFNFS